MDFKNQKIKLTQKIYIALRRFYNIETNAVYVPITDYLFDKNVSTTSVFLE